MRDEDHTWCYLTWKLEQRGTGNPIMQVQERPSESWKESYVCAEMIQMSCRRLFSSFHTCILVPRFFLKEQYGWALMSSLFRFNHAGSFPQESPAAAEQLLQKGKNHFSQVKEKHDLLEPVWWIEQIQILTAPPAPLPPLCRITNTRKFVWCGEFPRVCSMCE